MYTGLGYAVTATMEDDRFVNILKKINQRFDPKNEPLKASTFREHTGVVAADLRDFTRWLEERTLSVTKTRVNQYLKFLKCRRMVIYNICHPKAKEKYVHPALRMYLFLSFITTIRCYFC